LSCSLEYNTETGRMSEVNFPDEEEVEF